MIEVKNLCKTYGSHNAVSDLTFTIGDKRIYGFLGPNGAGKSTTMNIITGCLAATSGSVSVDGVDIIENSVEAKSKIGYLPEQPPVFADMTPEEYLLFIAKAKKIEKSQIKEEVDSVMKKAGISSVKHRLIKNLSKGYKQRVGIAQAILGNPSIIILDEPTVGLDPKQIIEIRRFIKELGKEHTVILSSHILSEIQSVCDEILIISDGKLAAYDTAENLVKKYGEKSALEISAKTDSQTVSDILNEISGIIEFECLENNNSTDARISIEHENVIEDIFFAFAERKTALTKMFYKTVNLEDIYMKLTSKENIFNTESEGEEV